MAKTAINEIYDEKAIKAQGDKVNAILDTTLNVVEKNVNAVKLLNAEFANAKGIKELTDNFAKLNKVENDNAIAAERLTQAQLRTAKMMEQANKTATAQTSAYKDLSDKLNANRKAWKDLAATNQENTAEGKKLLETIKQQDAQLKKIDATVGQHQRNVGNYGDTIKGVGTKLMGFIGALGLGFSAVEVFNKVIESTNDTSDNFNEMMKGAKEATSVFFRAIATGDWSNLLGKMREAYDAGVEYEKQLDRLRDRQISQNAELSNIDKRIAEFKLIARTEANSLDVKKKALAEIKKLEAERLQIVQTENAKGLKVAADYAASLTGLSREGVIDLVTNLKKYEDRIERGKKTFDELTEKSKKYQTDRRTGIMVEVVDETMLNDLIAKKPDIIQQNIDMYKAYNIIYGKNAEIATKVSDAVVKLDEAQIQSTEHKIGLLRVENKLTRQTEKEKVDAKTDANKTIKKLEDEKLDDESDYNSRGLAQIDAKNAEEKKKDDELADMYFANDEKKFASFQGELDAEVQASKDAEEKKKQIREAGINASIELYRGLVDLQNASFEQDLQNIDEKANKDKEAKEKELEAAGNNAALKDEINKKYAAKEKALEKERRKIEIERAKFQKAAAIFGIILDTSKAIVSHLTTPWLIPFDVLTGGIQLAVAAAQPIPKYKTGRKGGKAEIATVSEEGVEGLRLKSGEMFLTPEKESNIFIPEGASIIPHKELIKNVSFENLPAYNNTFNIQLQSLAGEVKGLHKSLYHIADTVKNKQETYINITEKGLYKILKNGNNINEYINAKYKS